ncbi:MAG: hypothetical protein IKI76_07090 [Selenomonadaceae bacterium]|nr:hypothetical protein [Selenomonadaceae bacterium]MBR6712740.1 hypothetical protein [Selenomonadaceae bacterium]
MADMPDSNQMVFSFRAFLLIKETDSLKLSANFKVHLGLEYFREQLSQ